MENLPSKSQHNDWQKNPLGFCSGGSFPSDILWPVFTCSWISGSNWTHMVHDMLLDLRRMLYCIHSQAFWCSPSVGQCGPLYLPEQPGCYSCNSNHIRHRCHAGSTAVKSDWLEWWQPTASQPRSFLSLSVFLSFSLNLSLSAPETLYLGKLSYSPPVSHQPSNSAVSIRFTLPDRCIPSRWRENIILISYYLIPSGDKGCSKCNFYSEYACDHNLYAKRETCAVCGCITRWTWRRKLGDV